MPILQGAFDDAKKHYKRHGILGFVPPELRESASRVPQALRMGLDYIGPAADMQDMKNYSGATMDELRAGNYGPALANLGMTGAALAMTALPGNVGAVDDVVEGAGGLFRRPELGVGDKKLGWTQDNPALRGNDSGVDWLKSKRKEAEEAMKTAERGTARYNGITGSQTAALGQRDELWVDPLELTRLDGAAGEFRRPGDYQYDSLLADVKKEGWDHGQKGNAIVVGVNHNGTPFVVEGNTRAAVARDIGVDSVKVEVRYFNGGEMQGGSWAPKLVSAKAKPNPEDLPMDTASRMKRAEEMGFDIDAFKGDQSYDWRTGLPRSEFRASESDTVKSMYPDYVGKDGGHAGFFSDDPDVASRFATILEGGASYPVKLKFSDPLVIDAGGKPARAFQFERNIEEFGTQDDYASIVNAFRGRGGHDGVILKNTGDEGTVYIPLKPENVRSRFAKFDPAKKDSADLLASIGGAGLLGLGLTQRENANTQ